MTPSSRLSPEAKAAAQEIGRGFKFSSEQKKLIADVMTPLLEKWAAEGYSTKEPQDGMAR